MRLKLRLVTDGRADDIIATVDPLTMIGEFAEAIELGLPGTIREGCSSLGLCLGPDTAHQRIVQPGTTIGESGLRSGDSISPISALPTPIVESIVPATNQIAFNRSPRLDPRFEGIEFVAPEPPQPPLAHRFPIVSMLIPILIAAMVYAVTKSLLSILFVGLSPIMMLGSWLENRIADRKLFHQAVTHFRVAISDLAVQLEYAQGMERDARRREHPSVVDSLVAVDELSPLVWTRRPEHSSFLQVRLGLGTQQSRNTVRMPSANRVPQLWEELATVVSRFTHVSSVPIVADLRVCGNIGVAGSEAAAPIVRGLLAQLVALHSPSELVVAGIGAGIVAGIGVGIADGTECGGSELWDWIKWLPHVGSPHSPLTGHHLAANAAEAGSLVAALTSLIDERLAARQGDSSPDPVELPAVILFVHDDPSVDRALLVRIAERGPAAGVFVVWHAPSLDRLPAACRAFIEIVPTTHRARAGFVQGGSSVTDLQPEPVRSAAVERLARRLSPVVDSGAASDAQAGLPDSISLLELIGRELAESPVAIIDGWRANRSLPSATPQRAGRIDNTLLAVVGQTSEGPLTLDLRSNGPHALVGGTTGSGKSEFLQSWILGMAVNHSPHRVTFLLIDYKGGAAFADCVDLPHCVGLVTDLNRHLVRRALTSLDAELRYRERLLHDKNAKDLVELERRGDQDSPPSLVIVIDEFAALVAEMPEFVEGVIGIAQRGRSLGLHLILATQRPAGVVNGNVRANTNLRIALRMADEADSSDVTGSVSAASFSPAVPGRAIVKSGPGRVATFQSAYVGGCTPASSVHVPIGISTLRFGAGEAWDLSTPIPAPPTLGALTDIRRIVRTVNAASADLAIPRPRRPWLPTLAPVYRLEALPTDRTDRELVIGVVDDPSTQSQRRAVFCPDSDGNMAVFGASGSGKSTVLRSLAVAASVCSARGGPCTIYGIDFGSRGLQMLEVLPHVGSIISGDDHERIARLLRQLNEAIDERAMRYSKVNAATIHEYRQIAGRFTEPRIILLVDGVGAFRHAYEGGIRARWWDLFQTIAANGRGVGVHTVVTADRPSAVSPGLASTIQRRLVFRLANDMDYALVDVPSDAFASPTPPGRGFLDRDEVQIGVVGGSPNVAVQAAALDQLAISMERALVVPCPPIEALGEHIRLSELPGLVDHRPALGVCDDNLSPIGFETTGAVLVTGPPRSGRSTTVATMIRSIAAVESRSFVLFGADRSPLSSMVAWTAAGFGAIDIARLATELNAEGISDRIVVVIESIGDLLNTDADLPLQDLVRACRSAGGLVIAEGETSSVAGSWPLLQSVKANRSGIVLQPDQMDGETLFKTPFPRTTRAEFPAGRGVIVCGGVVRKLQVALPE